MPEYSPFKILASVFIGGGLGSVFRYLFSLWLQRDWNTQNLPWGTLFVNIVGCLLIGYLTPIFMKTDSFWQPFLLVGFFGGFTTFSTFSLENWKFYQQGNYELLVLNIVLSILLGLFAVIIGFQLHKNLG